MASDISSPPAEDRSARWATIDAAWYWEHYRGAFPASDAFDEARVVAFHRETGQGLRYSPNPLFDEAWYLSHYPNVAAAVADGTFQSGFDHYCQTGYTSFSPHWLFSEVEYCLRQPRIAALIKAGNFLNGYDHYLSVAMYGHKRHPGIAYFDPDMYLQAVPDTDLSRALRLGPYYHYLAEGIHLGPAVKTSLLFDPDWYAAAYPEVKAMIEAGDYLCYLQHYLTNATPTEYLPLNWFSERDYADIYPDVGAAVLQGVFRSGYAHYINDGANELRTPRHGIDLRKFVTNEIRAAFKAGNFLNYFELFLSRDPCLDKDRVALGPRDAHEDQTKRLFQAAARASLPLYNRNKIDFTVDGKPDVSVVIVVHNHFALTLMALASLRQNYAGGLEVIVIDSGSSDETRTLSAYVTGAKIVHLQSNEGYLDGCNIGLEFATADMILYLNNDLRLGFGAMEAAIRRLRSDPGIGAVGGKIIRTNGLVQEAGSMVYRGGDCHGYMRDAPPDAPEVNFVRDVDFCSAAFLLVRADLLHRLQGYDTIYRPAYYEDVDLCMRIWEAGYRVVYDPYVTIEHLEHGTSTGSRWANTMMRRNRGIFVNRHARALRFQLPRNTRTAVLARGRNKPVGRVLFIEDQVPMRGIGSGFVRSNELVHTMASIGYHVTVFPVLPRPYDMAMLYAEFPDTVEVMHTGELETLSDFLEERAGYFDRIWIGRTHNLQKVIPILNDHAHHAPVDAVILDTEALDAPRARVKAGLLGKPVRGSEIEAVRRELEHASYCQRIIAVNELDAHLIAQAGHPVVSVIGHMRELRMTPRPFEQRSGILFLGAIHEQDSPNYDSLVWLVEAVFPHLLPRLPEDVKITIAGYRDPRVDMTPFAHHPRINLLGQVDDLYDLFDRHRVFIAPTRYAGGVPYKVHEAASFGIPVVTTRLLARQLGWRHAQELLAAAAEEPWSFALELTAAYTDSACWHSLRENAARSLAGFANKEIYRQAVAEVLAAFGATAAPPKALPAPVEDQSYNRQALTMLSAPAAQPRESLEDLD